MINNITRNLRYHYYINMTNLNKKIYINFMLNIYHVSSGAILEFYVFGVTNNYVLNLFKKIKKQLNFEQNPEILSHQRKTHMLHLPLGLISVSVYHSFNKSSTCHLAPHRCIHIQHICKELLDLYTLILACLQNFLGWVFILILLFFLQKYLLQFCLQNSSFLASCSMAASYCQNPLRISANLNESSRFLSPKREFSVVNFPSNGEFSRLNFYPSLTCKVNSCFLFKNLYIEIFFAHEWIEIVLFWLISFIDFYAIKQPFWCACATRACIFRVSEFLAVHFLFV